MQVVSLILIALIFLEIILRNYLSLKLNESANKSASNALTILTIRNQIQVPLVAQILFVSGCEAK